VGNEDSQSPGAKKKMSKINKPDRHVWNVRRERVDMVLDAILQEACAVKVEQGVERRSNDGQSDRLVSPVKRQRTQVQQSR
jgi:hypothetical protein